MLSIWCRFVCRCQPHPAKTAAVLTAAALSFAFTAQAAPVPFSHYQEILNRHPFGAPPPVAQTNTVGTVGTIVSEEEAPYIIPPGLEQIRVTLLSRFQGTPAAGFVDRASNTSYYLLVGQSFDEFELLHVDLTHSVVSLRRGDYEAVLPLWVNPATTNQADVMTFGMPAGSGSATVGAPVAAVRTSGAAPRTQARSDELQKRREEALKKREEERRETEAKVAQMTPEERDQHLRDINTDIIINNSGPPLPIELNERDLEKLSNAGFDIPGYEKEP